MYFFKRSGPRKNPFQTSSREVLDRTGLNIPSDPTVEPATGLPASFRAHILET